MQNFPNEFLERMRVQLGEDYPAFLSALEEGPFRGLRWNPLKCTPELVQAAFASKLAPAPFSPFSFYLVPELEKIGSHPLHHAGAFYVQEPSAASAVTVLSPEPGENVLDLCAAPGGKSTQIAGLLAGRGLLWSNEYVKSRANILLSNLERLGVRNAVVSSCHPDVLCGALAGFFDKVLVDAPCSGEGMFRKEPRAVEEWSAAHTEACAQRQSAILDSAADAVRRGGVLVYSTCTFSEAENEGVVKSFLFRHPEFEPEDCGVLFGRLAGLPGTRRILPMDGGEGHFVAKLRRASGGAYQSGGFQYAPVRAKLPDFYDAVFQDKPKMPAGLFGSRVMLLPEGLPELRGLTILRAGVALAEQKGNRMEPSHAAFMAAKPEELRVVLDYPYDSPELHAYLRGEELAVPDNLRGYVGVAAHGVLTGFGKCSGGRLKNRYPKGLREFA